MTYIRELDHSWHDPELDTPFRCDACGFACTWEDCDRVLDSYLDRETLGLICPDCRLVTWLGEEAPA
jgi:hypothetical protein